MYYAIAEDYMPTAGLYIEDDSDIRDATEASDADLLEWLALGISTPADAAEAKRRGLGGAK